MLLLLSEQWASSLRLLFEFFFQPTQRDATLSHGSVQKPLCARSVIKYSNEMRREMKQEKRRAYGYFDAKGLLSVLVNGVLLSGATRGSAAFYGVLQKCADCHVCDG
jgi:hypothetical protein